MISISDKYGDIANYCVFLHMFINEDVAKY